MGTFKFIDKMPIKAFCNTEVIVEAETLEEAKEKIIAYYRNGNEPSEYDETDDIRIHKSNVLYKGEMYPTCISLEDKTELEYGVFK